MPNLVLLIACFLLGVLMRRIGRFPEATPSVLNAFIINVSLPALTLLYVHELPIDGSLAYPTAMAWVLFGLGMIFFVALGRAAGWSRGTIGQHLLPRPADDRDLLRRGASPRPFRESASVPVLAGPTAIAAGSAGMPLLSVLRSVVGAIRARSRSASYSCWASTYDCEDFRPIARHRRRMNNEHCLDSDGGGGARSSLLSYGRSNKDRDQQKRVN